MFTLHRRAGVLDECLAEARAPPSTSSARNYKHSACNGAATGSSIFAASYRRAS